MAGAMNEVRTNSTEAASTAKVRRPEPRMSWIQPVAFLISIALAAGLCLQKIYVAPIVARNIRNFGAEISEIELLLLNLPTPLAIRIGVFAVCASFACFASRKAAWLVTMALLIANVITMLVLMASQFRLMIELS